MPDPPRLLVAIADHLKAQGIARWPDEAAPAGKPPLWLQPRSGTPAPGEGDSDVEKGADLVVGVRIVGRIPTTPGVGHSFQSEVAFRMRAREAYFAEDFDRQLHAEFAPHPLGYRTDWVMAGLHVVSSREWTGFQDAGSDPQAYDFYVSYLFETLAT